MHSRCNIMQTGKRTDFRNYLPRPRIWVYFRCLTKSDYEVGNGNLMKTTGRGDGVLWSNKQQLGRAERVNGRGCLFTRCKDERESQFPTCIDAAPFLLTLQRDLRDRSIQFSWPIQFEEYYFQRKLICFYLSLSSSYSSKDSKVAKNHNYKVYSIIVKIYISEKTISKKLRVVIICMWVIISLCKSKKIFKVSIIYNLIITHQVENIF